MRQGPFIVLAGRLRVDPFFLQYFGGIGEPCPTQHAKILDLPWISVERQETHSLSFLFFWGGAVIPTKEV